METIFQALIPIFDGPTKSGLPFLPAFCLGIALIGLLFLAFIFLPLNNPTTMYQTKITRTVKGDLADPNSSRELQGISPEELCFLKLAIQSAILEAQAFQAMDDPTMKLMLQNAFKVSEQYGFPSSDPEDLNLEETRSYFHEREQHSRDLFLILDGLPESDEYEVNGITPKQFEHLVTSIQAAVREAAVFADLSPEQARLGMLQVSALYQGWGVDAPEHYQPYLGDFPGFCLGRGEVLYVVLGVVNQSYWCSWCEDIEK